MTSTDHIHIKNRGTTLLELLVAISVTSLLAAMLTSVVSSAGMVWKRNNDTQDITAESKAALGIFQSDLQAGIFTNFPDNTEFFRLTRFPDSEGPQSNQAKHADWLLFFSASKDRDEGEPGVTSAVSYRLVYQDIISGKNGSSPRFYLYRVLVDPETTFSEILYQDSLRDAYWTDEKSTPRGNVIASNIVDFQVTPHLINSQGQVFRVPTSAAFRMKGGAIEVEGAPADLPIDAATKIHSLEIELIVLSPSGLVQLDNGKQLEEVIDTHGRKFSQIVTVY